MRIVVCALALSLAGCHANARRADCILEPIPPSAWRAAALQLGIQAGNLAEGVVAFEGDGFGDCQLGAPLTSLEIIAHGHLAAVTLYDGSPGVEIRRLQAKPVYLGDLKPGESVRLDMRW